MTFPILTGGQTTAPPAPEFHQNTLVERGALVLPPVAGQPARIYFEVTDRGDENAVCICEVAIEHTDVAKPFETRGPDMRRLANVPIHQGETVEFGPWASARWCCRITIPTWFQKPPWRCG